MGSDRKNGVGMHKQSYTSPNYISQYHQPDALYEFCSDSYSTTEQDLDVFDEICDDVGNEEGNCNAPTFDLSQFLADLESSLCNTLAVTMMAISDLFSSSPSVSRPDIRLSWKEFVYLILAIVMLTGLSVFLGVTAGITISIHYFDTQNSLSIPLLEARKRDLGPHQRVTISDYNIALSNVLHHPSVGITARSDKIDLTLGKVVTISKSGRVDVVMVVEEMELFDRYEGYGHSNSSNHEDRGYQIPSDKPHQRHGLPDSRFKLSSSKIHPKLCSDGVTFGFDNWDTLRAAIDEANFLSAERFLKGSEYFASISRAGEDTPNPNHYDDRCQAHSPDPCGEDYLLQNYNNDVVFTICPGSTLNQKGGPIFVNAPNIVVECGNPDVYYYKTGHEPEIYNSDKSGWKRALPSCRFVGEQSYLSFGPQAQNIRVRSLAFQSAKSSSFAFSFNGAHVLFEECIWLNSAGTQARTYSAVAGINSNSNIIFSRCEIGLSLASLAKFQVVNTRNVDKGQAVKEQQSSKAEQTDVTEMWKAISDKLIEEYAHDLWVKTRTEAGLPIDG